MELKSELEKIMISENCFMKIYINLDEANYVLEVNYMNGKFVSEKIFPNNLCGVESMENAKGLYRSEYDVKCYFGII